MEAFRDRTIKIDVPYNIKLNDEIRIYEKDFNKERIRGMHIAPHTLETAAMWAVLTRLEEPKKAGLNLMQKLKLYNGKMIPNFTEDSVKELIEESPREGMQGISPRYIQDKVSNALVSDQAQQEKCINPFMVMNELESGLSHHSLLNDEETKKHYRDLLGMVKEEYEDISRARCSGRSAPTRTRSSGCARITLKMFVPIPSTRRSATNTPAKTRSRTSG
jgi:serine protein kinase